MRRRVLLLGALGGALVLPACGFAPAYAPGGAGARLRGRIRVEAPATEDGTRLAWALEERLGPAGPGSLVLAVEPAVEARQAAVTPEGAITRYTLEGRADWRLLAEGRPVAQGEARALAGYSATGTTVALGAAAEDARERLMAQLADAVTRRLLLLEDLP